MRILNAEPLGYCNEARQILRSVGEVIEEHVSQKKLAAKVRSFDVLIVRLGLKVTREVIESADRLRVVVTATTGLDHIDLDEARERNIEVLSLQGEREFLRRVVATAEHTWALLLAITRRVPWAFDEIRSGGWNRDRFRGRDLHGKRLGILGLGRIGEKVARYGLAFGMQVGAYDPKRTGWVQEVSRFEAVDDLMQWSEVLSVHLPLNSITCGFLDEKRLRLLPLGGFLVNTSRGAIVDENALVKLLEEGHVAGAALDVLAIEQPMHKRALTPLRTYAQKHDNLLITPHLGGATIEAMQRTEVFMAMKLRQFLTNHNRKD